MEGPLSRKVMTARIEPKFQTVLEPHAALDLSTATPFISSVQSLAISSFSDTLTLVYAGMTSGTLLLLSTNPKSESPMQGTPYISSNTLLPQNFSLLQSVSISNFPVDWIYVIVDARTVLLLSDGSLFLVDMFLEHPVKKLSFIKGVSVICRRFSTGDSETSNLLDYSENNSTSLRFFQKLGGGIREKGGVETQCDGSCIFALISGKRLFLAELILSKRIGRNNEDIKGSDGSFSILKEFPCVEGVRTMVWVDDSIVVGTTGGYTLISCMTGQNGLIFSLPNHSSPQQLLSGKECNVLLMLDNVGVTINANGQPIGGSLVFRQAPDSLGEISPYLIVVRDGKLELYDKKIGSCIQIVNFAAEGVGNCIVAHDKGGCGKFVAVATPSKIICYRKIPYEEQIKDLLRKKNFKEALALVEELVSEGELAKELLSIVHAQVGFLLFFDMHFEEAVNHFLQSETMQPSEIFPFILQDPNRWSLQVQRNRYWGMHPPPAPLEDVIDEALLAIQRAIFLKKAGVETDMDEYFILNPPSRTDMLELALKNIIRYLEVSRQKDLILSVREGVDTLLMYLYRALNRVGDMEKLASSENHCVVEEIETLLDESGHLRTLAFLYARKGMSSKALNIWCVLARNYAGFQEDLGEESASIMSGKEIAASRAAEILEESCNQDLILQHLGWISDINQMLAVKILTSEKRVNQLSADEVITAIDTKKVEILQRYLQWLVEDQDSNDPRFHTLYALSLAQSALETFQHDHASHCLDVGSLACKNLSDMKRNSFFQNTVRMRLQNFLQSSDLYDFEEVLDLIEGSELWLEKAILYKKLGQETIVLFILALKLEDSDAAEQYCAEIGRPDAYMQLLDMYLAPQDGKEPMFKAAVRLLHNHGELLDPLQVLETLSLDMPLQLASDTILRMFRARIHHHRQGQVMLNLSCALDIDARLARMEERSRYVQINDENLCDSCHARLGTKLFAMYPDDTIVCYKCFRRQGESTSVRGRNFKQDALIKPAWLVIR